MQSILWGVAAVAGSQPLISKPLIVAPCFHSHPAYAPLKTRQQFNFSPNTAGEVSLVADVSKCLTMSVNGTVGPVTLETCLPHAPTTQIWTGFKTGKQPYDKNNRTGLVGPSNRQVCSKQATLVDPLRNTPMWLQAASGLGACLDYDSGNFTFSSTTKGGEKNQCLTYGAPIRPCDLPSPAAKYAMCDLNKSVAARVADLISRLEDKEKPMLLVYSAIGIDRLWIEPLRWWNEALHGLLHGGAVNDSSIPALNPSGSSTNSSGISTNRATEFPSAISTAASFNKSLFYQIGSTIGDEARASSNSKTESTSNNFWTPNLNIFRDPRYAWPFLMMSVCVYSACYLLDVSMM